MNLCGNRFRRVFNSEMMKMFLRLSLLQKVAEKCLLDLNLQLFTQRKDQNLKMIYQQEVLTKPMKVSSKHYLLIKKCLKMSLDYLLLKRKIKLPSMNLNCQGQMLNLPRRLLLNMSQIRKILVPTPFLELEVLIRKSSEQLQLQRQTTNVD